MVHIFNHYVPGRLIVLALIEALVLLVAAYIGISIHQVEDGSIFAGVFDAIPLRVLGFALVMMIIMSSMGLYQPDVWNGNSSILGRMVSAFILGVLVTGLISHLSMYPRPIELGATVMTLALAGSLLIRAAYKNWGELGLMKSRVLVLGTGSRAVRLAESAKRDANHKVVGFLSLQPARHFIPEQHLLHMPADGSLMSVIRQYSIDKIVVAVRDRRNGVLPVEQLLRCRMSGIKVMELPTFFEREHRQVLLDSLNPSWMVFGEGFRQGFLGNLVKRLFDLVASGLLFVLALPVMLVTAVCIYIESAGPILFRQERVGQGGKTFTLYKFRSMKVDAESSGTPQWATANDDRVTRVGRFIRLVRIDELPQIFNVLKGEMSFVGPRPERPYFVDQLKKQVPFYDWRHSAKPGITGWAQIRYPYGASIDDAIEKLQYDLYYVKNHSLFLDLMILFSTVEVVIWGKGAR